MDRRSRDSHDHRGGDRNSGRRDNDRHQDDRRYANRKFIVNTSFIWFKNKGKGNCVRFRVYKLIFFYFSSIL